MNQKIEYSVFLDVDKTSFHKFRACTQVVELEFYRQLVFNGCLTNKLCLNDPMWVLDCSIAQCKSNGLVTDELRACYYLPKAP